MVKEWVGTRHIYGEEEKCTQHFGGDACRKVTISKSRHTWNVNITMDLKETPGSSRMERPFGNKEI
jgi:hypothetical protein